MRFFTRSQRPATVYSFSTAAATSVPQYLSGPSFWANPTTVTITPMITNPVATFYTYDALDNLSHVRHRGNRPGVNRRTISRHTLRLGLTCPQLSFT